MASEEHEPFAHFHSHEVCPDETHKVHVVEIWYLHDSPTREQREHFFRWFANLVNDEASPSHRIVLVFNMTKLRFSAVGKLRKLVTDHQKFMEVYRPRTEAVIHGVVVITGNAIIRTAVNGLLSVIRLKRPVHFCGPKASVVDQARKLVLEHATWSSDDEDEDAS